MLVLALISNCLRRIWIIRWRITLLRRNYCTFISRMMGSIRSRFIIRWLFLTCIWNIKACRPTVWLTICIIIVIMAICRSLFYRFFIIFTIFKCEINLSIRCKTRHILVLILVLILLYIYYLSIYYIELFNSLRLFIFIIKLFC